MTTVEELEHDPVHAHQNWWVEAGGYGTGRWSQKAFLAGVRWVMKMQLDWDNLTAREGVLELRKKTDSIYFPLFRDDSTLWVDCPNHGRVVIDSEGICFQCGFDFDR